MFVEDVLRGPTNSWIYAALAREANSVQVRPNTPEVVVNTFKIVNKNPDVKFTSQKDENVVVICDGFVKICAIYTEATRIKALENLDSADLSDEKLNLIPITYKVDIRECFENSSTYPLAPSQEIFCPKKYEILILLEHVDCLGSEIKSFNTETSQQMQKLCLWYYESKECKPLLSKIIDERVSPVITLESASYIPKRQKMKRDSPQEIIFDQNALLSTQSLPTLDPSAFSAKSQELCDSGSSEMPDPRKPKQRKMKQNSQQETIFDEGALLSSPCLPTLGPSAFSSASQEQETIDGSVSYLEFQNTKEERRKREFHSSTSADPQSSRSRSSKYLADKEVSRLDNLLIPSNLSVDADVDISMSNSPESLARDSSIETLDYETYRHSDIAEIENELTSKADPILSTDPDALKADKLHETARTNSELEFSAECASDLNMTTESDLTLNVNDSNSDISLKLSQESDLSFMAESSAKLILSSSESGLNQSYGNDSDAAQGFLDNTIDDLDHETPDDVNVGIEAAIANRPDFSMDQGCQSLLLPEDTKEDLDGPADADVNCSEIPIDQGDQSLLLSEDSVDGSDREMPPMGIENHPRHGLAETNGERTRKSKPKKIRGIIRRFTANATNPSQIGSRKCKYTFKVDAMIPDDDSDTSASERSTVSQNVTTAEGADVPLHARSILFLQANSSKQLAAKRPSGVGMRNGDESASVAQSSRNSSPMIDRPASKPARSISSELFLQSNVSGNSRLDGACSSMKIGNTTNHDCQPLSGNLRNQVIDQLTSDRRENNEIVEQEEQQHSENINLSPDFKANLIKYIWENS